MRRRGWDQGASKSRSVMERIEGESPTDDRPSRESGLTSLWSSLTREPGQTPSRSDADMSQAATLAGAAPGPAADWHSINWKKVYRTVRRLQRVS